MEDNAFRMSVLINLIYRFNTIPIKTSVGIFMDIDKLTLKYIWKDKASGVAKNYKFKAQ